MKESAESPFRPKSSRTFINPRLTSFPQLPSSVYYDQITISSPNLTSFQNYSNIIKSPSGNNSSLVYLKLDNTGIANYRGAVKTPSLKYIFLASTPLSTYHFYRVMTAIVFGADTLQEIDHTPIKKSERAFCTKYSDLLYPYLIDGWLLTMVDPIRIFDPVTRRRRVLYPPPERRKSLLSSTISITNQKSTNQQSISDKKTINQQSSLQEISHPQKTFSKDGTEFMSFLEKVFFESNLNDLFKSESPDEDDSTISDLKSALSNSKKNTKENEHFESDSLLFVNFVLRAAALRPLNVDSIVKLLKEVITEEISIILKQSLFHTNFYSNSALANFIESLLDQEVFTTEDIKPLFFSVYERFENWNSPFSLNSTEEEQNKGSTFLMVPFIDFFCPFSKIIERVDIDLYNSLLEQAGENEKEQIELYRMNDEKKKEIWKSLSDDDYSKFFQPTESTNNDNDEQSSELFTKEQLKQCVIDLTPWDVKEQQNEVIFAFSGSPQCLFHSPEFNENTNSSDLLKVATIAGGSFEIFNKIFEKNDNNNSENAIELAENSIRFHRFEMLKEIINSMLVDDSHLSSLAEVAIDSMEINAINYIVVDKKANLEENTKEMLLNRAISSSIMNNDLDQTSKSRFINPLNSLLSGYLSLQKAFVILLYKIGLRSSDSLIFSIQSQSLELVRFFLSCENNPESQKDLINRRGWDHLRWTPLHVASNIGSAEIVKELMKYPEINVNLRDKEGNTPLMIAVSNNFNEVVKELLKGKKLKRRAKSLQKPNQLNNNNNSPSVVDPNIADKYGWTPILVAIGNKNASIVQMLLDYNKGGKRIDVNQVAYVNQNGKENENDDGIDDDIDTHSNMSTEAAAAAGSGMTPLNLAVDVGDDDIFNLLLKRSDIDVNAKTLGGDSALSIAVKKRNLQFINDLISTKKVKKGIIVNAIKVATNLGLTEIAQLLNNFNQ